MEITKQESIRKKLESRVEKLKVHVKDLQKREAEYVHSNKLLEEKIESLVKWMVKRKSK